MPRKIRLTDQDLDLLRLLAEHRLALPAHGATLLERAEQTARARLERLVEGGYAKSAPVFRGRPAMYLITSSGLEVIGSSFEAPRLNLVTYEHDVGTVWLWLAARRGTFGPQREVISERRLRSHDAVREASIEPLGVRLGGLGPRGQERLHYPDLLLHTADGRRIALELELSSKGPGRLQTILGGYAADPRFDGVVYLVENATVARSVEATARRLGVTSRVHMQRVRLTERRPGAARGATAARVLSHGPRRQPGPRPGPGRDPGPGPRPGPPRPEASL